MNDTIMRWKNISVAKQRRLTLCVPMWSGNANYQFHKPCEVK